ncbi:MAG: CoA pyrophosphatase [Sutterellaceae bacterium]|nr:CoA pyrophosphatase [Burkholderiaceae bacterium]MCX7901011.1 CoA pyrophosphatase [Burkholderiaceae bacterium]MDW8430363.1 CoA pyrophosphatase [Sutterellaceae bacterium]
MPPDPAFADPAVRGPAVVPECLTARAIRARFAAPPRWQPETDDARRALLPSPLRPAAVLVPLVARGDTLHVLLTERAADLPEHAGQISFPGGRVEAQDPSPVHTALREASEEVGLAPDAVEVLGTLPDYVVATGYRITPVVGLIERPFVIQRAPFEVAEVFEVPLPFLMNPQNHERRLLHLGHSVRTFYAMPYTAHRRYFIWGATAAVLRNLYYFLRA